MSAVDFTASVDRDLLRRVQRVAAQNDTSVDALFNLQLRHLVETFESGGARKNTNYATLLAFSLGRLDDLTAIESLGLDGEEDLFLLMAQAHLPMPRLPEAETARMAAALHELAAE
jgi:hypothetical protein